MLLSWMLDLAIACFAVFGFYCVLQMLLDALASVDRFWVTVKIRNENDADMLDMLLHEANSAFFRKKRARTVVLISSALFANGTVGRSDGTLYDTYADVIDRYGAECYIMDWD